MRIILVLLLLIPVMANAQLFTEKQIVKLRKNIISAEVESADMDNDGLPDAILFVKTIANLHQIKFLKGDTLAGFTALPDSKTLLIDAFSSFSLVDYDNDNDLDIVIFGNTSSLLRNAGEFDFEIAPINLPAFIFSKWVDLDNNGLPEIVGTYTNAGEWITGSFVSQSSGEWKFRGDTIALKLSALEVVDANHDGYHDLFLSGVNSPDSLFSGFLLNQREYSFMPYQNFAGNGSAASGDLNGDGIFDVVLVGKDVSSAQVQKIFLSTRDAYQVRDSVLQLTNDNLFLADLDSDGLIDISQVQQIAGQDTLHSLLFSQVTAEQVLVKFFRSQCFTDFEHDGNLDLIQITEPDSLWITFYQNQAPRNLGPTLTPHAIANKIFDKYFFFWSPATDDHTNPKSVTYDLMIEGTAGIVQAGGFDILNERQFSNRHGNTLTHNFKLFDQLPGDPQKFAIQAIDNALHARIGNGICVGEVTACPLLESMASVKEVCPNETVLIASPENSLWFSFSAGFLGTYSEYAFEATTTDTLFYYDPAKFDCTALQAFIIKVRDLSTIENYVRYACKDSMLNFSVENSWSSVAWSSKLQGALGTSYSIVYKATEGDTVSVRVQGLGCSVTQRTAIVISKPVVTVAHDHYAMMKGSSVQLSASGAEHYTWTPRDHLSNPFIANPTASPDETFLYAVTGYDSINCPARATVRIIVENAGFIPTLFTPNDDGKNDVLKIYGLKEISTFRFTIRNREGRVVYESTNAGEVIAGGWDGAKNGTRQPAGVYFWNVSGEHPSGELVRLNGKTEGSIILAR